MKERKLKETDLKKYILYLQEEERAGSTIQKYAHTLKEFFAYCYSHSGGVFTKETVIEYKQHLLRSYAPSGVNSELAALNGFFEYKRWRECRVRPVRVQRSTYCDPAKELTREEYLRLVNTAMARKNERLALLLQTICSTGIRVSEVQYLTVAALNNGRMEVYNKRKCRLVLLPAELCAKLLRYCRERGIRQGCVFVTRSGRPLDRTNIWTMMKTLCRHAQVDAKKVFPHNLRHLFARCFYQIQKDLEHLATILGHSNVNTTRIYTCTSGAEHRRQVEQLRLLI